MPFSLPSFAASSAASFAAFLAARAIRFLIAGLVSETNI
jgi:hypothetical protein